MTTPPPPPTVEVSFAAQANPGSALGKYDSAVDITVSGTEIHFVAPAGWAIQNVNIYTSANTSTKASDMGNLRGQFNQTT